MWRRLALSCSICSSMSERVVRRRPFLSTLDLLVAVAVVAVVGPAFSGASSLSSTLALMVGRHFPARDAGLPQLVRPALRSLRRAASEPPLRMRLSPYSGGTGVVASSSNDVGWREPATVLA